MEKSIADIKKELSFLDEKDLLQFAEEYKSDERSGVLKLVEKARKDHQKYLLELERIYNLQYFERKYSDYQLLNNLKKTSKNKGTLIILMHDTADVNKTYTVLKSSISYLKSQGYEFRNFYDFINNQF